MKDEQYPVGRQASNLWTCMEGKKEVVWMLFDSDRPVKTKKLGLSMPWRCEMEEVADVVNDKEKLRAKAATLR